MVALGLLGGLVLGCGAALVQDRRSGLVYSEDELKALLQVSMLERLPLSDTTRWDKTAQLLAQGPLVDAQSVALVPIGTIPQVQIDQLQQVLAEALGSRKLLLTRDLIASRDCSVQLLVATPGACKRQELQQLREQLALQGSPVAGWLLIYPALEA